VGLFRRLLYGIVVLALLALAVVLGAAVLSRLFGYRTLVVQGGSMGHSIPTGSLVYARWIGAEDVELGDVILVQEESASGPAHPKLHRVVSLEGDGDQILVQTKGDTNETVDPKVYILPDRVLTPAYTLPYLGYLVGFVVTPLGWALLVALPATVVCLLTLRGIWAPAPEASAEAGRT
jgi:signal peptidase I